MEVQVVPRESNMAAKFAFANVVDFFNDSVCGGSSPSFVYYQLLCDEQAIAPLRGFFCLIQSLF